MKSEAEIRELLQTIKKRKALQEWSEPAYYLLLLEINLLHWILEEEEET